MANYLSLFSGIGGMDLGLDRAGWTCVGQVEIDPFCRLVLERHWPEVPRHDDVRTCVEWWLGESRPTVDMVCGGFPCQPVSVAGRQRAQADERWLWPAAWALIRDLRPAWALLENVPGLLGRGMGDVLGDLAAVGYDAEWDCIPAAALGAPHRRDRVFVVAYPAASPGGYNQSPQSGRCGAAVARINGTSGYLADSDGEAGRSQARQPVTTIGDAPLPVRPPQPRGRGGDLADPHGPRELQPSRCFGQERRRASDSGWWAAEPRLGRVAHGVPARVDRLRGLGNAVVPQVAQHVGELIMAAAHGHL